MARRSKEHAQRRHFNRRALERLGVKVNGRQYDALVADIQEGRARFVERQSNRITVWRVEIEGEPCGVVYDKLRGTLVTVLTVEMVGTA